MFLRSVLRPATLLTAVLAIAISLAAQSAMAQTLRVWSILNPNGKSPREQAFKKLIGSFEAANPNVKVQVEPNDFRTMAEKFFAAHQTGTAPDVIWVHTTALFPAIKLGTMANLDELFLKNWTKEQIADVDSPLWRLGSTPTAHYQIMHSRNMMGLMYRIDLFKEAGIDPKSLTTWDKFIEAAKKLTVRGPDGTTTRWGFVQSFPGPLPITPILFSVLMDGQDTLFDKNMRAQWSTPVGVKGLELMVDMIRKHRITPESAISLSSDDAYGEFTSGRAAIVRSGAIRVSTSIALLGSGKVGYLPTPSFTEGKYSPSEGAGWCVGVWSGGKQKELAGKFVEYISTKEADKVWAMEGGEIPVFKSTITDNAAFFADINNAYLTDGAADLALRGRFPIEGAGVGGWSEGLNAAVMDVLTNKTDPKAALEKAEAAYNRVNRR